MGAQQNVQSRRDGARQILLARLGRVAAFGVASFGMEPDACSISGQSSRTRAVFSSRCSSPLSVISATFAAEAWAGLKLRLQERGSLAIAASEARLAWEGCVYALLRLDLGRGSLSGQDVVLLVVTGVKLCSI